MLRMILSAVLISLSGFATAETYICSLVHFGEVEITKFTRKSNKQFSTQTTFTDGRIGDPDTTSIWSETEQLIHLGTVYQDSSIIYIIDKKTKQALYFWSSPSLDVERKASQARCVLN
jgi:hypothetical protein